eukprot:m.450397 g.450397  ORF g.450397 m.450397 type:complete len:550 (+) comp19991_c0_seq1:183-1832(+)
MEGVSVMMDQPDLATLGLNDAEFAQYLQLMEEPVAVGGCDPAVAAAVAWEPVSEDGLKDKLAYLGSYVSTMLIMATMFVLCPTEMKVYLRERVQSMDAEDFVDFVRTLFETSELLHRRGGRPSVEDFQAIAGKISTRAHPSRTLKSLRGKLKADTAFDIRTEGGWRTDFTPDPPFARCLQLEFVMLLSVEFDTRTWQALDQGPVTRVCDYLDMIFYRRMFQLFGIESGHNSMDVEGASGPPTGAGDVFTPVFITNETEEDPKFYVFCVPSDLMEVMTVRQLLQDVVIDTYTGNYGCVFELYGVNVDYGEDQTFRKLERTTRDCITYDGFIGSRPKEIVIKLGSGGAEPRADSTGNPPAQVDPAGGDAAVPTETTAPPKPTLLAPNQVVAKAIEARLAQQLAVETERLKAEFEAKYQADKAALEERMRAKAREEEQIRLKRETHERLEQEESTRQVEEKMRGSKMAENEAKVRHQIEEKFRGVIAVEDPAINAAVKIALQIRLHEETHGRMLEEAKKVEVDLIRSRDALASLEEEIQQRVSTQATTQVVV